MDVSEFIAPMQYCIAGNFRGRKLSPVYATIAGSPYIAWFVQYVWEIMICVDRTRVLNQCQVCAYCINFSVHPRRLFLSSKCSSVVVLNDGTAIKSQNGEKKASVSCHLPRNHSDIGTVLFGTF